MSLEGSGGAGGGHRDDRVLPTPWSEPPALGRVQAESGAQVPPLLLEGREEGEEVEVPLGRVGGG